jgi:hypothetical protein
MAEASVVSYADAPAMTFVEACWTASPRAIATLFAEA